MNTNRARDQFNAGWDDKRLICVGLDPDPARRPPEADPSREAILMDCFHHCVWSIEAGGNRALAFKPNIAFFARFGAQGLGLLQSILRHARLHAPNTPIVLDFKRGDIGNTNRGYVEEAIEYFGADGITLNPYLGMEANEPFLALENTMLFFLCRTSNPGAGEFQDRKVVLESGEEARAFDGPMGSTVPLYQLVAHNIATKWNTRGNCGLVVGATYPGELAQVRGLVGDLPILAPGVGTQGGDVATTVKNGIVPDGRGLIINASSGIMYAADPAEAFRTLDEQAVAALAA